MNSPPLNLANSLPTQLIHPLRVVPFQNPRGMAFIGAASAWFAILGVVGGLFGCDQPTANLTQPDVYSQNGIFFKHPKNWTIDAEVHPGGSIYMNADTGGSAVFLVLVQPENGAPSLLKYAADMSEKESLLTPRSVGMNVSNVEIDPSNSDRATQKMFISVVGVIVPHQIEWRRVASSDTENKRAAYLKWQTAVEDANETAHGAALIFDSFQFR